MRRLSGDARTIAVIIAAVAVIFADVLFFGSGFYVRDVYRNYMPWRFVFREVLLRWHELPLWNPWYSAGQPLAADPGVQVFYPGTWLTLLPSFRLGFNLEVVAHIALAAVGMFALLRTLALRTTSALFGTVAFALGGPLMSMTNLLPWLTSVSWWPLVVLFELRLLRRGSWRDAGAFAIVLAMPLLAAEVAMMAQLAMIIAAVAVAERCWMRRWPLLAAGCAIAFGIALVQLGPALELKNETSRAHDLAIDDVMAWSMPLDRAVELVWPAAHGRITADGRFYRGFARYRPAQLPLLFSVYCGVAVPLLFLAGLAMRVPWRGWTVVLVVVSYALAIGANGPVMPWLWRIGLWRTIRYPEKMIIAGLFAMIVFAAIVLDRLDRRIVLAVLLLTVIDVGRFVNDLAERVPARTFAAPPLVAQLADAKTGARMFSWIQWDYRLPVLQRAYGLNEVTHDALLPYANVLFGLRAAGERDFTKTTQQATADFVRAMWGAYQRGVPLPALLAMANVEYIVRFPTAPGHVVDVDRIAARPRYELADQIVPIRTTDDFSNAMAAHPWSPAVAFVSDIQPFVPASGEVVRVHEGIDAIDIGVRANGRALLLIRNTPHRFWRATIDGAPAPLHVANVGFTALELPGGMHHVALRYRDPVMAWCALVSALALIAAIIIGLKRPR